MYKIVHFLIAIFVYSYITICNEFSFHFNLLYFCFSCFDISVGFRVVGVYTHALLAATKVAFFSLHIYKCIYFLGKYQQLNAIITENKYMSDFTINILVYP